ncbi:hypothetical protein F4778DRAFT_719121 [Xylariomycetidae sp. FL2044]|nr:hypothetical protein F4778DRAFT_719121 [Xylariomycetidae sp. FL2044]
MSQSKANQPTMVNKSLAPRSGLASSFRFISAQDDNEETRRRAKSHAANESIKSRQRSLEQRLDNFRHFSPGQTRTPRSRRLTRQSSNRCPEEMINAVGETRFDPFETLAIKSSRLQSLLRHAGCRQAVEPIFSLADHSPFQNFVTVFKTGLDNPALSNALLLALATAVNDGRSNTECLTYKSHSIRWINERMRDTNKAATSSTIGAILLLTGVEYRTGAASNVQVHMDGIWQILELCKSQSVWLSDGIKRAIFWQDLNAAMITGSTRLFSHDTFPELRWERDPFLSSFYTAPPGFEERKHLFGDEFMQITEDIHALQEIRETSDAVAKDAIAMLHIDNQLASIESRLFECMVPNLDDNPILACCILALYLSTYSMYTETWQAVLIPSRCSSGILRTLQQTMCSEVWVGHEELLVWLVMIGGALAPRSDLRCQYSVLFQHALRRCHGQELCSWDAVVAALSKFVWTDKVFSGVCEGFWAEYVETCQSQAGRSN